MMRFTVMARLQCVFLCAFAAGSAAAAPTLYAQPWYEGPTTGEPDDLLLLPGYGFSRTDVVVYQSLPEVGAAAAPVGAVPAIPTPEAGFAPVVSTAHVPYSLTIRLPSVMGHRRPYALWVRDAEGEWSNPVRINDSRPLWLSPAFVYATAGVADLPRYLKIVGRNLDPPPGNTVRVRLSGPRTTTLVADSTGATIDAYVAQVMLPKSLIPGRYQVAIAGTGADWIALEGQSLEVRPDPTASGYFSVADPAFGGCRANERRDATACVVRAIAAANAAGGGTVRFGAGRWLLADSRTTGVWPEDGIVVPPHVNLRGEGRDLTYLVRGPGWNSVSPTATFTLLGNARIEGFTFTDLQRYEPKDRIGPVLQIGRDSGRPWQSTHSAPEVSDLVITGNRFDRTDTAIADGGLAMRRIFITYNEFGTYRYQLELRGNVFNMTNRFEIEDSVIAHNTFKPGSFLQVAQRQGPIASEIGASHRLDFSDNTADGAAADYLYSSDDSRGWRAAFFWHMNGNHEMLLMSNNVATCTGDKTGDGESIALDNSGNTFAFSAAQPVVTATRTTVTVAQPPARRQNDRDVPLATYYVGHWMQVGDGPGIGQVRKITGYSIDGSTGMTTFTVSPGWDVTPISRLSRVSVGREFWQTFILGNRVDHRSPPCRKSNRALPVGGVITMWAQLADSVVAGNQLFDTEGITFHENYNSPTLHCAGCGSDVDYQFFLSIRNNLIEGRYDTASSCTASGITGWVSAAPDGLAPIPTLGYGIDIAHNRLVRADNTVVGAIAIGHGWYDGPEPHEWPIVDDLIVQHNFIEGVEGPVRGRGCDLGKPRMGIAFPGSALSRGSVLYANSCAGVRLPLGPVGKDTIKVCAESSTASCECQPAGGIP